ncbi:MAG: hypothetical protein GY765_16780 [bacterium]|nr:hypothetical protein [bacterium]
MCTLYGFPAIYHNGSGDGYQDSDNGKESFGYANESNVIDTHIENGAGYFLSAHSDILKFSNMVEMARQKGTTPSQWLEVLDSAVLNIKNARTSYSLLINEAEATQYDWNVVYQLWFFEYTAFRRQYGLNSVVFNRVVDYLEYGDITGLYRRAYNRLGVVGKMLETISDSVARSGAPLLSDIWKLNEYCAETLMEGQYIARVFYSIK